VKIKWIPRLTVHKRSYRTKILAEMLTIKKNEEEEVKLIVQEEEYLMSLLLTLEWPPVSLTSSMNSFYSA